LEAIRDLMMRSREAFVDYTMPLGLAPPHRGDHYAPMPENTDPRRADWSATYYHRADSTGIGFDRTRTGSDAVSQYRSPLREQWADPATVPENLLLWFHHVPWDRPLRSGRTLWDELVAHYTRGADEARAFEERWVGLRGKVDAERHQAVLAKLHQQAVAGGAVAGQDRRLLPGAPRRTGPGRGAHGPRDRKRRPAASRPSSSSSTSASSSVRANLYDRHARLVETPRRHGTWRSTRRRTARRTKTRSSWRRGR